MALSKLTSSRRARHLCRLVPDEVVVAHEHVRAVAARPGIVEPQQAVAAADRALLEVAALLAGRSCGRRLRARPSRRHGALAGVGPGFAGRPGLVKHRALGTHLLICNR